MTESLIELGKSAAALAALAGLIVLAGKGVRGMIRMMRRMGRVVDEVLGDGDKQPGWGKRLAAIEQDVTGLKSKVAAVLGEVRPNGGGSMRDEITRIAEATGASRDDSAA